MKTCGCSRNKGEGVKKNHQLYPTYKKMMSRCNRPKDEIYKHYGARGISVCDRWSDKLFGFDNFVADMGLKSDIRYSIDRINNDLGYSPDNCRWATKKEQSRNTRTNRIIVVRGVEYCLSQAAEVFGINRSTLVWRLNNGISPEDAVKS